MYYFKKFKKRKLDSEISRLDKTIDKFNFIVEKSKIYDLAEISGNTKRLFIRNFFSGIFKGVGISIGFYIITAIVLILLNYIVKLNIPIIGDYILDIVEIVETNRK